MDSKITPKQEAVLDSIKQWVDKYGTAPKLKDIMSELGYSQLSSVHRHVDALRTKGLLPDVDAWSHGIKLSRDTVQDIPLVGNVPCGSPVLAEENVEAFIPYATSRLQSKTAKYFFLKASGDSMDKAKPVPIHDGDLLLVRMQQDAKRNDIVIALIGDESTCKRLSFSDNGWYTLQPETSNPCHKPRVMLEDFGITGVVEDVICRQGVAVA